MCCVAVPPRYWPRLHLRVHTQLIDSHRHTYTHASCQDLPQQPCQQITKPFLESCSHQFRSVMDMYAISRLKKKKKNNNKKLICHHTRSNSRVCFCNYPYKPELSGTTFAWCHSCVDNRTAEQNPARFHLIWQSLVWLSNCSRTLTKLLRVNNVSRSGMKTFIHILLPFLKTQSTKYRDFPTILKDSG